MIPKICKALTYKKVPEKGFVNGFATYLKNVPSVHIAPGALHFNDVSALSQDFI